MTFLFALFVSCEEYYYPNLEPVSGMLVVESHITNDPNQNYLILSVTSGFYSSSPDKIASGATVNLIEVGGQTTKATESNPGYFTFPKTPVAGKRYQLRVFYLKDTYESEFVVMPPLPSIDSLYTKDKVEKSFRTDAYGNPAQVETPGREIYIDAPITPQLKYYRFNWRAIIQWVYYPPATMGPPSPPIFGWKSTYDKGIFNIAGPKEFSVSDKVRTHPIISLPYNEIQYLDSAAQIPSGWILIMDQYGITKASFDFHEKLNQQFVAEGSLFDPVLTQVYGNIHCKNDPSKIALGFFDLNSYRQYRYFLDLGAGDETTVVQRRLNHFYIIPNDGYFDNGIRPAFWENKY
ncbi:MAG: DUF4249 domain-containing protein [Bacteroidota bacterium]|nr:DUF4249 domain-containing protein [Bacteroidota bacterium]